MILNREDALYAANVFIDYFQNFGRIDDYLRKVKLERMSNYPTSLTKNSKRLKKNQRTRLKKNQRKKSHKTKTSLLKGLVKSVLKL